MRLYLFFFLSLSTLSLFAQSDRIDLFKKITSWDQLQLKEVYKLSDATNTYRPQGMAKKDDELFLSAIDKDNERGYLLKFSFNAKDKKYLFQESIDITQKDKIYHLGGLNLYQNKIYGPIAKYKDQGPSYFFEFDSANLKNSKKVGTLSQHAGTTLLDPELKVVHLIDWDIGVHTFPTKSGSFPELGEATQTFFRPTGDDYQFEYQDCKPYFLPGHFLCAGIKAPVLIGKPEGVLDLIKFNGDSFKIIHRLKTPLITPEGKVVGPNDKGLPPTANPFDFESVVEKDHSTTFRFFFAPYDHPYTHLLIYQVNLK